jgi:hypothetical protein
MDTHTSRQSVPGRISRCLLSIALAAGAVYVLATCGGNSRRSPTTTVAGSSAWLLTSSALAQLAANPTVKTKLQRWRVYEILRDEQPQPGFNANSVVAFPSAAALRRRVRSGELPPGTYAVLYDGEAWPFTPVEEQSNPVGAARRAAQVAHAHGLRVIVTPSLGLIRVLRPETQEPLWRGFLRLNLAGRMARTADFFELQSQSLERNTATYSKFVRTAASQARAANPQVKVLAGLSTNPAGPAVTVQQLTDAIQATRSIVDGYWLNIPSPGAYCRRCSRQRSDIGIQTLLALH